MGAIAGHNDHGAKKHLAIESRERKVANSNIADLSNDPYFVKKAESAKKLLEKYGTPQNKK